MNFECGDYVKVVNDEDIYIIESIDDFNVTIKGMFCRTRKVINSKDLVKISLETFEAERKRQTDNKTAYINKHKTRNKNHLLYGRVLHIDGDEEFLKSCLSLYKEMNVFAQGIYIKEDEVKNKIENLLLNITPDIIVLTGHDVYNGHGIKDLSNYEHSKDFIDALRVIRKHFDCDSVVTIVGACGSNFDALIANGANFASSPKRINIHTYDPAVIAIKVATTSCNKVVDFNQTLEFIENKRDAFGGIETKGKMKILL